MNTYDVVVVGGGPTGLLLAGDLAKAGHKVAVLEKHLGINTFTRAFGLSARTLEILHTRGLAKPLIDIGNPLSLKKLNTFITGNADDFHPLYPIILAIPQPLIDQQIEKYALENGAEIFRGLCVTAIRANADPVEITAVDSSECTHYFTGKYIVAADGWKSTIRNLLNIDFPGKTVFTACAIADVILDPQSVTDRLLRSPNAGRSKTSTAFTIPYGYDNKFRVATINKDITDINAPITIEQLTTTIKECIGEDVIITHCSNQQRFSSDERLIDHYRHGNIFFIGDAAHCHSPVGGQGLNTGLHDSANLSWKLSLALSDAPDRILDTYHHERHPLGKRALKISGRLLRVNTSNNPLLKLSFLGYQQIVKRSKKLQHFVVGMMTGLGISYPHTNLSHQVDQLIGTRCSLDTVDGSIFDLLDGIRFILVLDPDIQAQNVKFITSNPTQCLITQRKEPGPSLLVRPDGYIAAVSHENNITALELELRQWLPAPMITSQDY